jgi:hypothetical protein
MKINNKRFTTDLIIKISIVCLILINGRCTPSLELTGFESAVILAEEKFGDEYNFVENQNGKFILCYKIWEDKNQLHSSLHYFVYEAYQNEIIYEEKLNDSKIKWLDDQNLEITNTPEVISGDDNITVFILNVLTKEKRKSNFNNE